VTSVNDVREIELLPGEQCPYCGQRRPRDSSNWRHGDGDQSYVPVERVRFIFIEIAHRIGTAEGARRMGTGRHNLYKIINRKPEKKFVERRTVKAAIAVLKELRENGVVYSKQSIRRGAVARGEEPTRPTKRSDFYRDPGAREEDRQRHIEIRQRQKAEEERLQQLSGY
jgi:hypothetical protein